MAHRLSLIASCLLPLVLGLSSARAEPPHDAANGVECLECHALGEGELGISLPRTSAQELGCKSCHNPTGQAAAMSDVAMHVVGGGTTTVDCGSCHFVHFPVTTTDTHPGGITAPNLSLIRSDTAHYVPGALEPALFQVRPDQFAFAEGNPPYNGICQTCHTQTAHHRNDDSSDHTHNAGSNCMTCHPHGSGFGGLDHALAGVVVPVVSCMECHGDGGQDPVADVHGSQCGLCHADPLGGGPLVEPLETTNPSGGTCVDCHGTLSEAHQGVDHTATPGSGSVIIFADDDHDDAGWYGTPPYFDVPVDCTLCHNTDLPDVHAGQCGTCHPAAYGSLGTWNGSCQQGACHTTYHDRSIDAHIPFSDSYSSENDCTVCHGTYFNSVKQERCLNCHAAFYAADGTPPVSSSDALATYTGPGRIRFSITDSGKVAAGTTFYSLDGAPVVTGKDLMVTTPGAHSLEFWSADQAGNVETSHKTATFTILEDTTPPVTTSNAKATYFQGATIILAASDASTLGVKSTYYKLNGGPTKTGTVVSVPATSGTVAYTLLFWSDDWSGNTEAANTATFSVTSGTGTLKLVWGDSDITGPPADPEAWAEWTIRRGGSGGPLVTIGSGQNPGWSGVTNIPVQVSPTPYWVSIWWWDSYYGWDDNTTFPSVLISTPGQVERLSY